MHKDVGYSAIHISNGVRNYCHEILIVTEVYLRIILSTFVFFKILIKYKKKKGLLGKL